MTRLSQAKVEKIREAIKHHRSYRFCGPGDDLDEISAVTLGYRHLITQFQRLAGAILTEPAASVLNSISVEPDNLYSAFDAHSEIEAMMPDLEEAIADATTTRESNLATTASSVPLPKPVCSIVGQVLGSAVYHHETLNNLFYEAGAQGEVPQGTCVTKCQTWLKHMHLEVENPIGVLGKLIEEFMDGDVGQYGNQLAGRSKIEAVLGRSGLSYHKGGVILGAERAVATRSLIQLLQERDLSALGQEFERCMENVETDPPAAITAASSILESLCKLYIEDNGLEMPNKQTIGPLWRVVTKHIGFDPSAVEDDDVKRVLSGLASVVDGVGSLRTHTGSAHGRGRKSYSIRARHARLAVHASHTLVAFVLETWELRAVPLYSANRRPDSLLWR